MLTSQLLSTMTTVSTSSFTRILAWWFDSDRAQTIKPLMTKRIWLGQLEAKYNWGGGPVFEWNAGQHWLRHCGTIQICCGREIYKLRKHCLYRHQKVEICWQGCRMETCSLGRVIQDYCLISVTQDVVLREKLYYSRLHGMLFFGFQKSFKKLLVLLATEEDDGDDIFVRQDHRRRYKD